MTTSNCSNEERLKRQTDSKRRWNEQHYKQLNVQIDYALYERISSEAAKRGLSLRQYVINCLSRE